MAFIRRHSPFSVPTIILGGPDLDATNGGSFFESTVIDNSATMKVGDVVIMTTDSTGNATGKVMKRYTAAADRILGVCQGFGQANGKSVDFDSNTNDTVTVASDNETVKKIYCKLDVTPHAVYSAPFASGQTIHDTSAFGIGSTIEGNTGANAGQLNETTITATTTAHLGWACLGPDPADQSRGLVTLVEGIFQGALN